MPTQTLQIIGNFSPEIEIEFAEIVRDYGDGYDSTVRVGHSDGQLHFRLVYNVLPGAQGQSILDPETSTNKSQADYLWDFFVKRKQDGEPFLVKNPRTEANVLVKFAESRLSYTLFAVKLFSTGIRLKQYRPAA